jgi:hypothetical protein
MADSAGNDTGRQPGDGDRHQGPSQDAFEWHRLFPAGAVSRRLSPRTAALRLREIKRRRRIAANCKQE